MASTPYHPELCVGSTSYSLEPTSDDWGSVSRIPTETLLLDLLEEENLAAVAENKAIFPFFSLPSELREEIYTHAWHNTSIAFRENGVTVRTSYGVLPQHCFLPDREFWSPQLRTPDDAATTRTTLTLPRWININQQFRPESLANYYRHAHFTINPGFKLPSQMPVTNPYPSALPSLKAVVFDLPSILFLRKAHKWKLNIEVTCTTAWCDGKACINDYWELGLRYAAAYYFIERKAARCLKLSLGKNENISALLHQLQNSPHKFTTNDLEVDIIPRPDSRFSSNSHGFETVHCDFSLLAFPVASLHRCCITINDEADWYWYSGNKVHSVLWDTVRSQCLHVVKGLVGGSNIEVECGYGASTTEKDKKMWFCEAINSSLRRYKKEGR